ncbi:FecR family protein [bacterium]|nr:FecR domain-containing protein [bacterium]MBU3955673.1 FecR family protein [bacterium]MBU4134189.1 FecR family protein [bacterium]
MINKFIRFSIAVVFAGAMVFISCLRASQPSGTILSIEGKVTVLREDKWGDAEKFSPVYETNFVKTSNGGSAEIMFDDETAVRFEENTEAEILSTNGELEISLKSGRVTSSVVPGEDAVFFVSSPLAIIGVRGTEFTVTHSAKGTSAAVYKGNVEVENRGQAPKKIKVSAGSQSFVYEGLRPSAPVGLGPEYVKYRKTVLGKFVKRTIKNRKNKEKILLKRMNLSKTEKKVIIKNIKNRNTSTGENFKNRK